MVKSLKDYRNNELIEEIGTRKNGEGDKYTVVAAYSFNAFIIFFVGIMVGITIYGIAQWGENSIDRDTLNEVCTALAGEESVYSSGESTSDVIVCKPYLAPDETILDDEKIRLVGYSDAQLFVCSYECIVPDGKDFGGGSESPVEDSDCRELIRKGWEECYSNDGEFSWFMDEVKE